MVIAPFTNQSMSQFEHIASQNNHYSLSNGAWKTSLTSKCAALDKWPQSRMYKAFGEVFSKWD